MAKFESQLGSKSFEGQQLREFDIPDESGYQQNRMPDMSAAREFQNRMQNEQYQDLAEIERQVKVAREAKRTGKERLNDGAKRRIEMLIGMTRTTREVDVLGNAFGLQTLRSKEMRDAIMVAAEYDGTVQSPFEIRRQLLARSLTHVAGVEIAQFVGSDSLESKLSLIDELDEPILNRLFDEYQYMVNEARDKFAIKNDADVKEVVEDLKK